MRPNDFCSDIHEISLIQQNFLCFLEYHEFPQIDKIELMLFFSFIFSALAWGSSVKHQPQKVGIEHVLNDEDVVQIVKKV